MDAIADAIILLLAMAILVKSSQYAVRGLERIARSFSLNEFTLSFIVIGMASVLPELALGVNSAIEGTPSFGLGVIFGSNVADLTLILGLAAIYAGGIRIRSKTITGNIYYLLLVMLPLLMLLDGAISRADGAILLLAFSGYIYHLVQQKHEFRKSLENKAWRQDLLRNGIVTALALGALFASAHYVSVSAEGIAHILSIPHVYIGILVAVMSCLPELIFALRAIREKHPELGLGDILGNVAIDCTFTLGIVALIAPIPAESPIAMFAGLFMAFAAVVSIFFLRSESRLSRREGIVLVIAYVAFLIISFGLEQFLQTTTWLNFG